MKYLLLDIEDTISPRNYKGVQAVVIDTMGIYLGIPKHIADWLIKSSEKAIKIVWCTSCTPYICSLVEKTIDFKTEGSLKFSNRKAYTWAKLHGIIEFCNKHEEDVVVLADNDIKEGTRGINDLPSNLELVWPSDTRRGCLSIEDLTLIENLYN